MSREKLISLLIPSCKTAIVEFKASNGKKLMTVQWGDKMSDSLDSATLETFSASITNPRNLRHVSFGLAGAWYQVPDTDFSIMTTGSGELFVRYSRKQEITLIPERDGFRITDYSPYGKLTLNGEISVR